ncbi:schlafen 4, partial [Sigmodon hispidus]
MPISIDLETDYAELVLYVGEITFGEKTRKKLKDVQQRRREAHIVSQAVCALLNSGGGVVKAHIKNSNYNFTRDGVGLDWEKSFVDFLASPSKYLDYMQNHDDFLIFVKPLITDFGQHICTLKTNIYLRSLSSSYELKSPDAVRLLKVIKDPELKSCSRKKLPGKLNFDELQCEKKMLATFFNKEELTYRETLCFTKSKHAELKMPPKKKIKEKILEILPKTVSAFANTDGGYLFIGLDGKNHQIIGFEAEESEREELEEEMEKCIQQLPVTHFCEEKQQIKYKCRFIQVLRAGAVCSYVCALRVERFCCAVFTKEPDSWHVEDNCVKRFSTEEWVKLQMDATPGFSQGKDKWTLHSRIPPLIPCRWSVYDIAEVQPKSGHLPVESGMVMCSPGVRCTDVFSEHERYKQLLWTELGSLHQGKLVIFKTCASSLGFQEKQKVILNGLYGSQNGLLTLHSFVLGNEEVEGDRLILRELEAKLKKYCKQIALTLKQMLVNLGGYPGKIGIAIKITYCGHQAENLYDSNLLICYPRSYYLTTRTCIKFDVFTALDLYENRKQKTSCSPTSIDLTPLYQKTIGGK